MKNTILVNKINNIDKYNCINPNTRYTIIISKIDEYLTPQLTKLTLLNIFNLLSL